MIIFFTQEIKPFTTDKGMHVNPIACELVDTRKGYFLSQQWSSEVEAKGAKVELINKSQLLVNDKF